MIVEQLMRLLSNVFVLILSEPVQRYKTYHSDLFSTSSESPSIISSESDFRQGKKHLNKQNIRKKPWSCCLIPHDCAVWHPTPVLLPGKSQGWWAEPGRLQSMGSQRVGHDWATSFSLYTFMHWRRKWQPTLVLLPGEFEGRE